SESAVHIPLLSFLVKFNSRMGLFGINWFTKNNFLWLERKTMIRIFTNKQSPTSLHVINASSSFVVVWTQPTTSPFLNSLYGSSPPWKGLIFPSPVLEIL